jgi:hypothetical protein
MLPLLLAILFGLMPQSGVVTHTAMLEPAQRTLDLIYNMEFVAHCAPRSTSLISRRRIRQAIFIVPLPTGSGV